MGVKYLVKTGLNYGPQGKRAEPGDVVNDLPGKSIGWLLADGHIEKWSPPAEDVVTCTVEGGV